jgi:alpha-beta hydrolase superfamily lysophospholipase
MRFVRWGAIAGAALGLLAGAYFALRAWGVSAIAYAPNHGLDRPSCPEVPSDAERIIVAAADATIEAARFRPASSPRGLVIVLHGIRDQKSSMAGFARRLAAHGYEAVTVDLRGHGCSTGDILTYGVADGEALPHVLNALDTDLPIGVYGPSYGGAAAIQLASRDPRVRAVVVASSFTSLRAIVPEYGDRMLGPFAAIVPDPVVDGLVDDAMALGDVDADDASSIDRIARVEAPVLVLHGSNDRNIVPRHGRELAAAAPHATFELIEGAGHDGILASPAAQALVLEWLDRHLARP